ncbi:MAG: 50S ribosomal protein L4 [Candidatus Micrarchaeota archaeon]
MKATVLGLNGSKSSEVELPHHFEEEFRPDLIKRAFHAFRSLSWQPKGAFPMAGMQTTAEYYGRRHEPRQTINTGRSRLPREKIAPDRLGQVRQVPQAVGGRRAHPPKPWTVLREKINIKEKNKAIRSAIAASASEKIVKNRGHKFSCKLPLVVSKDFEGVKKVKEAAKVLIDFGVGDDLKRAKDGRKMRSGRARLRKGGYKVPVSALIVFAEDHGIRKAARNLPGVDVVKVQDLNAELLAPGGVAGRLVVWTQDAVEKLDKERLFE